MGRLACHIIAIQSVNVDKHVYMEAQGICIFEPESLRDRLAASSLFPGTSCDRR